MPQLMLTDYCIERIRETSEAMWMQTERLPEGKKRLVREVLIAIANGSYGEIEKDITGQLDGNSN